ncbi:hypothetical protein [Trinickia dinghuensis]|uniref:DUF3828 domain-containing protein n=1 Tax=Trinickia dinghuensis TaxID=2291023 RepID=A0A3D8JPB4_9BURK|nr:hypothetical protein [Trinickia dinghuensis]RDU94545.1 hypothetical protein DWV00_33425 [Trinickia dinghuensis]
MKSLNCILLVAGVIYSSVTFSQNLTPSAADVQSIDAFAEKIYKIPYRNIVCAFSDLNPETRVYIDKKVNDKRIREKIYQSTFGDIFTDALFKKFEKQCVDTNWAGLKPDFRTADQDSEDDHLIENAPILKIKGKPIILKISSNQARVKILWRQIDTDGKNTQIMNGRTDLILVREHGSWRVDNAITNPSSAFDDDSVDEFYNSVGVSRLID